MRVMVVKAKSKVADKRCKICGNQTRPGEVVLFTLLSASAYLDASFVIHVGCTRALLADAPEGVTEVAAPARVQALRDAAIAEGAS